MPNVYLRWCFGIRRPQQAEPEEQPPHLHVLVPSGALWSPGRRRGESSGGMGKGWIWNWGWDWGGSMTGRGFRYLGGEEVGHRKDQAQPSP